MANRSKISSYSPISTKLIGAISAVSVVLLLLISMNTYADASSDDTSNPSLANQLKAAQKLIYKEKYKVALKMLETTLEQDKENADVWNLIGYASRKSGDTDTAAEAYTNALSINQDHLGALEYQGELFITLGNLADAENNLARLAELCPTGCEEREDLAEAIAAAK